MLKLRKFHPNKEAEVENTSLGLLNDHFFEHNCRQCLVVFGLVLQCGSKGEECVLHVHPAYGIHEDRKGQQIIPRADGFMAQPGPEGGDKQQFSCSRAEGDSSEGTEEELRGHRTSTGDALLQSHPKQGLQGRQRNPARAWAPHGLEW